MVTLTVNGMNRSFDGDEDMPLLWYLRDDLRLTGTRFRCGAGLCGACTVHVDGLARPLVPDPAADASEQACDHD
jgi:isoquinoline 1-oxidoreductase alpha subunit